MSVAESFGKLPRTNGEALREKELGVIINSR